MMHRPSWAALALVPALALAGCGDGGDEREDREEVRRAVITAIRAAHAGDPRTACARYTRAYVRETVAENKALRLSGASCDELVRRLEPVLRQLTPNPRPKVTAVTVSDDRANARMDIETHFGPAATKVFLVRDGGRWKIDHDEDYADGPATRLD